MHISGDRAELAARNNAYWCDIICSAHSIPGDFYPSLWINRQPTPRFYPNAVTLAGAELVGEQLSIIAQLMNTGLPAGWAVKDSFSTLDLSGIGFEVLFEASWIWLDPSRSIPASTMDGLVWRRVITPDDLGKWEAAWAGNPEGSLAEPPIFLPSILADQDVVILAAYQGQQIIARAVANRTGPVVGLSNVFAPPGRDDVVWTGCINQIRSFFPSIPVVGYEKGSSLQTANSLGFDLVGPLRVWMHPPHS
jgi:hypothetical protein